MRQRTQVLIIIVCAIPLVLFGNPSQAQGIPDFGPGTMPEAGKWYVSPGGNNSNSCASPAASCVSINVAIGKASAGDTIYVQVGTYYTDPDSIEVIHLDKGVNITGGWNESFTTRSGRSVIEVIISRRLSKNIIQATISHLILRNSCCPCIKKVQPR
jgi:hypothetical protein